MSYTISSDDEVIITLNEKDTVKSVIQNIKLILATRRFSVPLYRDFGLSMEFIDKPALIAKPLLIAEIQEAIEEYEPRATVLAIDFEEGKPGNLIVRVEVGIRDE